MYLAALLISFVYALARGGGPERTVAALFVAATGLSAGAARVFHADFRSVQWSLLYIDGLTLAALLVIAAYARRYWPSWISAIQLLTVLVHVAKAYDPGIVPRVYGLVAGELAYPALAILAIGTWRHSRRGAERDWSWQ